MTSDADGSRIGDVLREMTETWGGHEMRLTTVRAQEEPPPDHVTTAHCLAFEGDSIVLALHVTRGWTIPGGFREPGETAVDAMRREASEEAGIVVDEPRVVAYELIEHVGTPPPNPLLPIPSYQVFYVARLQSWGEITTPDECTEARLFTPDEARASGGWVSRNRLLYEAALSLIRG